jgi:hypothetical protein
MEPVVKMGDYGRTKTGSIVRKQEDKWVTMGGMKQWERISIVAIQRLDAKYAKWVQKTITKTVRKKLQGRTKMTNKKIKAAAALKLKRITSKMKVHIVLLCVVFV